MSQKEKRIIFRIEYEALPLLDEIAKRTSHGRSGAIRFCILSEAARRRLPIPDSLRPDVKRDTDGPE